MHPEKLGVDSEKRILQGPFTSMAEPVWTTGSEHLGGHDGLENVEGPARLEGAEGSAGQEPVERLVGQEQEGTDEPKGQEDADEPAGKEYEGAKRPAGQKQEGTAVSLPKVAAGEVSGMTVLGRPETGWLP